MANLSVCSLSKAKIRTASLQLTARLRSKEKRQKKKQQHETPAYLWSSVTGIRYLHSSISRKQTHMSRQSGPESASIITKKMFVLYTLSPTLTHTQKKKKTNPQTQQVLLFLSFCFLSRHWPEFVPSSLAAVPDAELLPASAASAKWVRPLSVCWY